MLTGTVYHRGSCQSRNRKGYRGSGSPSEIARKAYWNSSFFGGSFNDLLVAGFVNHPPVASSRDAITAAGAACTASIHSDVLDNGSFDPDSGDLLTLSLDPPGPFALGQHTISLIATDSHGASTTASSRLNVTDQTAPVIRDLAADKAVIDGRSGRHMELVTVSYTAADNCGSATAELVVSGNDMDERDSRDGRRGAFEIIDANHVLLSTDHQGRGDRVFTIAIVASDPAGNRSTASTTVRVASR